MTPEQYRPGLRVWYEPSPGVRFLGETIDDAPRSLGGTWVTTIIMSSDAYGRWRLLGQDGPLRQSVPAAALFALHIYEPPLPDGKE